MSEHDDTERTNEESERAMRKYEFETDADETEYFCVVFRLRRKHPEVSVTQPADGWPEVDDLLNEWAAILADTHEAVVDWHYWGESHLPLGLAWPAPPKDFDGPIPKPI